MSEKLKENSPIQPVNSANPLPPTTPMRQIIIETDGTHVRVVKADVAGSVEFIGILQFLIRELSK